MKKVCIVVPYMYPVPAIKGGAVETLVEFLIDQNEIEQKFHFTVLSTYDSDLNKSRKQYAFTEFVYFKKLPIIDDISFLLFRIVKKMLRFYMPASVRFMQTFFYLKKHKNFDFILFENGLGYMLPMISKLYPKEKILNHLHWLGDGNRKMDESFAFLLPVSEFIGEEWKKSTGRDSSRVKVWKNCCNIDAFTKVCTKEEIQSIKAELNITKDSFTILYVGRIVKEKGVKELIEAINIVNNPRIHLLIVGGAKFGVKSSTPYEQEVEKLSKTATCKIKNVGFVHNSQLYRYYAVADLAVMPSQFQEPAGMVNIEAMATGTALITSRIGGIPEYTGGSALLIDMTEHYVSDLAKAITDLMNSGDKRSSLARQGKIQAREFKPQVYYNRFVDIIQEISQGSDDQ